MYDVRLFETLQKLVCNPVLGLEHAKNTNPKRTNTYKKKGRQGFTRQGFTRFGKMLTSPGQKRDLEVHKITKGFTRYSLKNSLFSHIPKLDYILYL